MTQMQHVLDIEALVVESNWKEMLMDLVKTEKLDPWSIDIVEVTDKFLEKVKSMQVMDLHIPANVILASSILLRMKSETLIFYEQQPESAEVYENPRPQVELPMLSLKLRVPPPRKITLQELIMAIEELMKYTQKRKVVTENVSIEQVNLKPIDIDNLIMEVMDKINSKADAYGLVKFSQLLENGGAEEVLHNFIPLLHLEKQGKIELMQEEFFKEILIRVLDDDGNKQQ